MDGDWVLHVGHDIHRIGDQELLGAARIAENESKVALIHAFDGDGEIFLRFERNVVGRIGSGIAVLVGIDTPEGEVAGMARPHPVVGVATELADAFGRNAHEAHILKHLIHKQKILIAIIERFDFCRIMRAFNGLILNSINILLDFGIALRLAHAVRHALQHLRGDIFHIDQEGNGQALCHQLLITIL